MALKLWTRLLSARLLLALCPLMCLGLEAPVLIGCVFVHRANVSCEWTPGDPQTTHYTLNVQSLDKSWTCVSSRTSCAVRISVSVIFKFCISVTAHGRHGNITSPERCQSGIIEIKLYPVTLNSVTSVDGEPRCLRLDWDQDSTLFLISNRNIQAGRLASQIEFTAHGQSDKMVRNVTITNKSYMACLFSPDTLYSVRIRHRYQSSASPWSDWSNSLRGRTTEGAPSSAPKFWRRVIGQDGHRLASLMWKPLPHALANGRVLFYNVTCQDEEAKVLPDLGNCTDLEFPHSSCLLTLPQEPCSCSVSASTSAGTSPKAFVWLSKADAKELPPPSLLSVAAVHDRSFNLSWAPPSAVAVSLSGFVVEWFVVTQKNDTVLHWERVNSSTTTLIITEGVEPFQRYAVSVRATFGTEGVGQSRTETVYTRQGVPSAGPNVHVQTSGRTVKLSWSSPVEQQHGFIQNYTLFYRAANGTTKRVVVPGFVERYSLVLSPGHFTFWMQASTAAGAGPIGQFVSANIGPEEFSVVLYVLTPIGLISLAMTVMVCVAQSKIVKRKLCQEIPDPSHSSMANWGPESVMGMKFAKPDVKFSEVVLLSDPETEHNETNPDKSLQTVSYPPSLSRRNPFKHDADFASCPVIYSTIIFPDGDPTTPPSDAQYHSDLDVKRVRLIEKDPGETFDYKRERAGVRYSQKHFPAPAAPSSRVSSQFHPCYLNTFASTPLLELETIRHNTSLAFLPFPSSLLMDFMHLSESSVPCDPYLPA